MGEVSLIRNFLEILYLGIASFIGFSILGIFLILIRRFVLNIDSIEKE